MTTDADPTPDADAIALNPVEAYRQQVTYWKRTTAMLAVALVLMVSVGVASLLENRRTLHILEKATGPEAQEQQGEVVNHLVVSIDCNMRAVFQEVLDSFPSTTVKVLTETCIDYEKQQQPTTTTGGG